MSTAQAQIYDGTVSVAAPGKGGIDPRRRRFGLNPGIYQLQMEAHESGQQQRVLPAGVLIPFRTKPLSVENFDISVKPEEYIKQKEQDFTAEWFIANVKMIYGEFGFREIECLTLLDDPERNPPKENKDGTVVIGEIIPASYARSAHGYFNAVHPSFGEIGYACPQGLSVCVTCRLELLGAPRFDNQDGTAPDWLQVRIDDLPDPELGEELRLALIEPHEVYREFAAFKWALLIGEIEKRSKGEIGIAVLGPAEHHLRNHLHEIAPADIAANTAASYGEEVGRAQSEGMKEIAEAFREGNSSSKTDELLAKIIERQDKTDDVLASLAQTTKQLAKAALKEKATD